MNDDDLAGRLAELSSKHGVPGASAAVLADGAVSQAAYGFLNVKAGIEATPESLFQIGSITKVYTTTVIMSLVEAGSFDLDTPVVAVLPEFRVADAEATQTITIRHLLCHSSGFDGDHFLDTGRGDDCLERYAASLVSLGQLHRPGATMSYSNAGFSLLGRIIEVVTGTQWDALMAERLFEPLGLTSTVTLPEDALRYRTALGHFPTPEGPVPSPRWGLMRSCGPAGLICASAADVIAFAQCHLAGGAPVLQPESAAAMQEPQVAIPDRWTFGDHWGLGWILSTWSDRRVIGHDGGTIGQAAYLRVAPDRGVAVALLTNGGHAQDLYQDLFRGLFDELADLAVPVRPCPPASPVQTDLGAYVGTYRRNASTIDVAIEDGELVATTTITSELAAVLPNPVQRLTLVAVDPAEHLFVTRGEGVDTWSPMVFFELPDGRRYVHFGARATPLV